MCTVSRTQRKKRNSNSASMVLSGLDNKTDNVYCSHSIDISEPPKDVPKPPENIPESAEDIPEEPGKIPKPPKDRPEPPLDTPEPPVDTPEPPLDTPEPPVDTPEPPVDTPEPPVDTPESPNSEYAEIGPSKVTVSKILPSGYANIDASGYANINATVSQPSDILDPHYHEASFSAPRVMFTDGDDRHSPGYTLLEEESIQKHGEYSNLQQPCN